MVKIAPSILAADFNNLEAEIKKVAEAGCDYIHIDVMDGKFVKNITPGLEMLKKAKKSTVITLDVHLMVEDPQNYIDDFMDANIITFHIESVTKEIAESIIKKLRDNGKKIGISIKPNTKVEEIKPFLDRIDMVLIMTVEPGLGGQGLIPETVDKIKELRKLNEKIDIEVDGGINEETHILVKNAGANILVAGTAIFKKENKKAIIDTLRE